LENDRRADNLQDFEDDKLSILDIKAVDQMGTIYDIEIQLAVFKGLVQRIVFYGCEIYAGQLKAGDDYSQLKPVYSICLIDGMLWPDAKKVHHAFRLADQELGRTLDGVTVTPKSELTSKSLEELLAITNSLQEQLRNRPNA